MTRKDIESQYSVDHNGIIQNPGQFEGEMRYIPYFWDEYLNGCVDSDDGKFIGFKITKEDIAEFPELKGRRTVKLYQRDDGFVCEVFGLRSTRQSRK